MVFDPKTWADGELITAADLNRLEQGIDATDTAQALAAADLAAATAAYAQEVA